MRTRVGISGSGRDVAEATGWLLLASLALQLAFFSHGGHASLGDVPGRFFADAVRPGAFPYVRSNVEYPVVVGLAMWIASLFGGGALGFFLATCVISSACAAVVVALLWRRCAARTWSFLLAPAFVLYAFHNWDLLAVVFAVAGVLAFERRNDIGAGALLAIGASAKVFPGLFLPVLVAVRLANGDRKAAARLVVSAVCVTALLNAPIAIASLSGWEYPARFQGRRSATWGSLWFYVVHLRPVASTIAGHRAAFLNVASVTTLAIALIAITVVACRGGRSPAALCIAVIAAFLLTNKVYSPNYDLWLVAFFPLVALPRTLRRGFNALSVLMWLAVFGMFRGFVPGRITHDTLPYIVYARSAAIAALGIAALRATRSRADRAPEPAQVPYGPEMEHSA